MAEQRRETEGRSRRGRRPQEDHPVAARSRITRAAAELMRRRGYFAMGLNDIVDESRAPKGSIYHYFPGGKEQIAEEAIRAGGRMVGKRIEEAFAASDDLAAALRYFARILARNLEESEFRNGCPVATTTLDAASESPAIGASCAASFHLWTAAIAAHLRTLGWGEQQAGQTAVLVLSSFEGALIMARATRDTAPLYSVAESLAHITGEPLTGTKSPSSGEHREPPRIKESGPCGN